MKKLLLFIFILMLNACALNQHIPTEYSQKIPDKSSLTLVQKLKQAEIGVPQQLTLEQIRKLAASAGATNFYGAIALTGGTSGAMDAIDGTNLATGDLCQTLTSTAFYIHYLNASSGAVESSPDIVSPDTNAGNKRWILIFMGNPKTAEIAQLAVTDGNIIVGNGSTWVAESGATARASLGAAASGANADITSMTGLTTPLGAAYGGTGVANNAANTLTFTGAHSLGLTLSANTALTLPTSGTLIANLSEDTTPQLGGNLDVNGKTIASASNGNITLQPNGTGQTIVYAPSTIVTSKSASADLTTAEAGTVLVSASSAYNLTMPNAVGNTGLTYDFVKTDFNYNLISLRPKYRAVIEDCEDAWDESVDADVTSSADTADYKVGVASAKLVVAAGAAAGDILATEAITSMDLSGDHAVRLWIKCSVATTAGDLQLLLGESANAATPAESLGIPALTAATWTEVDLTLASAAADRDAIISVGLKYVVDIGACDIWIDSVRAVKEKFNYPNDDSELKTTYPRLNTGGAKATLVSDGSNWIVTHEDLGQVPNCRVHLSTEQENITHNVDIRVDLDTEDYDIGNNFNMSAWFDNTTTATSAGKLVDSAGGFTGLELVGVRVKNDTDVTETYITAIDNDTTLSVRDDIFISGEDYSIAYSKFVVPVSGTYLIRGSLLFVSASVVADKIYYVKIYRGGVSISSNLVHSALASSVNPAQTFTYKFTAGDEIKLYVKQSSGVHTVDISGTGSYSYFNITLISKE